MRSLVFIFFLIPISLICQEIRMIDSIYVNSTTVISRSYKYDYKAEDNSLIEIEFDRNNDSAYRCTHKFLSLDLRQRIMEKKYNDRWDFLTRSTLSYTGLENGSFETEIWEKWENAKWIKFNKFENIDTTKDGHRYLSDITYAWDEKAEDWVKESRMIEIYDQKDSLVYSSTNDEWKGNEWYSNDYFVYTYEYDENDNLIFSSTYRKVYNIENLNSTLIKVSDDMKTDTIIKAFGKLNSMMDSSLTVNFYGDFGIDSAYTHNWVNVDGIKEYESWTADYYSYEEGLKKEMISKSKEDDNWNEYRKFIYKYDLMDREIEEEEYSFKDGEYILSGRRKDYYNSFNLLDSTIQSKYSNGNIEEYGILYEYFDNHKLRYREDISRKYVDDKEEIYRIYVEYDEEGRKIDRFSYDKGVMKQYNGDEIHLIESYGYNNGVRTGIYTNKSEFIQSELVEKYIKNYITIECFWKTITGIDDENKNDKQLFTYPNPAQDYVNIQIEIKRAGIAIISVYDESGSNLQIMKNLYLNEGKQDYKLDCSKLKQGRYFYNVFINGDVQRGEFIIGS